MAIVGVLNTLVSADVSAFSKGMDDAKGKLGQFKNAVNGGTGDINKALSSMGSVSGTGGLFAGIKGRVTDFLGNVRSMVGGFGVIGGAAALGGAAVVGFGIALERMAARGSDAILSLAHLSRQIGISVHDLSLFSALPGFEADGFGHALFHMQHALASGGEETARALSRMGLSLRDLRDASPLQQLEAIAGGFAGLTNQMERSQVVRALFGRGGLEMVDVLARGTRGLEEARQRARAFGLDVSESTAEAVRNASRAWSGFGLAMQGIGRQMAGAFAPAWEAIGNAGSAVGQYLVGSIREALPLFSSIGSAGKSAFDFVRNIGGGWGVLGDNMLSVWSGIADAVRSAIPYATAFFGMVGAGFDALAGMGGAVYEFLGSPFKSLFDMIQEAFGGSLKSAWKDFLENMTKGWFLLEFVFKRWKDGVMLGMAEIKLKWLELQDFIGRDVGSELAQTRREVNAMRALSIMAIDAYVNRRFNEVFGQHAAATAPGATAGTPGAMDQRSDHGFANRSDEIAYSAISGKNSADDRRHREQVGLLNRQAALLANIQGNLQRAPMIGRARL